jgi:predicted esterase
MRLKFILTLAVVSGLSLFQLKAQQTAKITSSGIGFLEYLPDGYNSNSNDYPIVIFLHGIGEKGTTSTDPATLLNSVQKVANVGLAKNVKNGKKYPFIMISPQLKSSYGLWPASYVMDVYNYVKRYLRIDERRVYITGLSLGGYGTWTTLAAYPQVFAASVPICSGGNTLSKACVIAAENIPLWAFHGTADNVVSYTVTTKMIDAVNACSPKPNPLAKYTLFSGLSHYIWDKVYNETNALNWMLSFTNGSSTPTTTNNPPTVSAGADKSITLPTSEIYLQGTASDDDGSIASYKWTKVSGGAASLGGATTSKLRAYNLLAGTYVFRLSVTDNDGATKYDDVKVTVLSGTTNLVPVANAGPDKTTSATSVYVSGSGTDKDGEIVSYKWIQYYGTACSLANATSPTLKVSGMKDGKYFFRLTVTDDKGATDYDNMQVVVSGTSSGTTTANILPVANAGPNKKITASSVTLYGSGSDQDGTIVSYRWTQYGGAATTLTNASSPSVNISGLRPGNYYFRLTVTDDKGATAYDNTLVAVYTTSTASSGTESNLVPIAHAGPDKFITDAWNSLKLNGSATDKDGRIVSYKWTQIAGEAVQLTNPNSPSVTVSDLDPGKYYLKLTVKDDDGSTDYDKMMIVVNES